MKHFLDDSIYPLPDPMVDQFCLQILPEIHHKIKWLNLELLSMERILLATNYPNLYGLGLYDLQIEKVKYFVTELYVCLHSFSDCLYLLDDRFNQLHTLYVNISLICSSDLTINNKEKLFNLKYFSLYCNKETYVYDESITQLLHRMSNLEKFDLCLIVCERNTLVDGNDLKINIINHMPRLNEFTFNIRLFILYQNQIDQPSNEDMQHTFKDYTDNEIISCIDYFEESKYSQCHIYSYSYKLKYYDNITNNFPGGLFKNIREISLFDEHSLEYEFFLQIAQ
ncbi:unnamed protein product [Rotaria sordida]|uniref:Uncharacterized protein n=1 Tax=Rotaria sordida TaxID=392033 RepID=A0A813PY95_9BILA|nr:unnamed protein product [Rotaria sordida]CAF0957466.1 unnamed protein product [Rotaria sordida]